MNSPSVESVFGRSWQLLSSNWVIIVPGVVIGIVVALLNGIVDPPIDPLNPGPTVVNGFARLGVGLAALALAIAQYTYTTGMAGAAWIRGKTTLADGTRAFERDAGNMFVAMIGLFVAGGIALLLMLPTIGLSFLALFFFFIYTFPAAVVGERPGFAAMADSCRMALARPIPTLIMAALIVVISIGVSFVLSLLSLAPLIGPLVSAIVLQALGAYVTLVVVGEYLALRGAATPPV